MIEVRHLNPVQNVGQQDPLIASFADSEWWNLIQLARQYGFELPETQVQYPRPYDYPVEIDAETSRRLYEAISDVYKDDRVPYAVTWEESNTTSLSGTVDLPGMEPEEAHVSREAAHADPEFHVGKLQVKQLMDCAELGAERGGIEIRRARDED